MKKIRVAINGFGRIGRAFLKLAQDREEVHIVAINDLGHIENMAYLLRYDSAYGKYKEEISVSGDNIIVGSKEIKYLSFKDPSELPWREMQIDIVVESTGFFATYEKAKAHIEAGAKRVVISAPAKDDSRAEIKGATVLMGVNESSLQTCDISSNASCTTNAGSPLLSILDEAIGIEKALLSTVHGYTGSQSLVDGPTRKNLRDGRAAAMNIIPSSTGAAEATTKAITSLKDKFDGISLRVPVIVGSIVDITFLAKRNTSREEVNNILKSAATSERWSGIFSVTEEPLVSSDIKGNLYASLADLSFTRVVGGNLVKVLSWYDNEMGYANTLLAHVIKSGSYIK